jgi:hypothetical protein
MSRPTNNYQKGSQTNSGFMSGNVSGGTMPSGINKSNVTLWKSKYNQSDSKKLGQTSGGMNFEEQKNNNIEDDYIENMKKQIYFMEMEMKLMKEREKEIEKSGGFCKFFKIF